jgi:PAS domain S-box-containing protein
MKNPINTFFKKLNIRKNKTNDDFSVEVCLELDIKINQIRSIIDSFNSQWAIIYDTDLRIRMLSDLVQKITWLKEEDLIGKLSSEAATNSENPAIVQQLKDVLNWKDPYSLEFKIELNHSWKVIYVSKVAKAIMDNTNEKIIWILWIFTDITEQKKSNQELYNSNELLSLKDLLLSIINGTTDFIYTKDLEGRYTLVNNALQKFIGLDENEILWKKFEDVFSFGSNSISNIIKKYYIWKNKFRYIWIDLRSF